MNSIGGPFALRRAELPCQPQVCRQRIRRSATFAHPARDLFAPTEEVTRFGLGIVLTTEGSDLGRSEISRRRSLSALVASVVNVVANLSRCTSHQPHRRGQLKQTNHCLGGVAFKVLNVYRRGQLHLDDLRSCPMKTGSGKCPLTCADVFLGTHSPGVDRHDRRGVGQLPEVPPARGNLSRVVTPEHPLTSHDRSFGEHPPRPLFRGRAEHAELTPAPAMQELPYIRG